ncbi:MAG TPA: cellulase family glycosylhydrolase, partial [Mycobacteriales bacterium]|nr:cellulase family glycosylhydrolase [Mycobacteriales bacterium]
MPKFARLLVILGMVAAVTCTVTVSAVAGAAQRAADTQRKSIPTTNPLPRPPSVFPLSTQDRWIVDAHGKRVKLASVNWYGAESPEYAVGGLDKASLGSIVTWIAGHGFNSIRLPWSNEMVEKNPVVKPEYLSANPELKGHRALDIYDRVIAAAARLGLMVVLDNHRSRADWCCDFDHGDGLWYSREYPESAWVADWKTMAARYRNQPAVVAADLRNEIRPDPAMTAKPPSWGDGDPAVDWKRAAELGGNTVLAMNPKLLIMVGGLNYGRNLTGAYDSPIQLNVPHRVIYTAHDYVFNHNPAKLDSYSVFRQELVDTWGKILEPGRPAIAPLYVGEFGSCTEGECAVKDLKY